VARLATTRRAKFFAEIGSSLSTSASPASAIVGRRGRRITMMLRYCSENIAFSFYSSDANVTHIVFIDENPPLLWTRSNSLGCGNPLSAASPWRCLGGSQDSKLDWICSSCAFEARCAQAPRAPASRQAATLEAVSATAEAARPPGRRCRALRFTAGLCSGAIRAAHQRRRPANQYRRSGDRGSRTSQAASPHTV
jgi:hypothetical protein